MKSIAFKSLCMGVLCAMSMAEAGARELYLAPGGTGNGLKIDTPMGDPVRAFAMLQAGDVLWVRGGVYNLSEQITVNATGTKDARICVFAYGNEKPVFDFSGQNHDDEDVAKNSRGIMHNIGANYWHYRGLEICNAADNGMKLEGSYCVVEQCTFHDNGDTGLQQGFGKDDAGNNTRNQEFLYGRYNIIVNCDSYNNIDKWSNGGDADGFAIKLFPGPGNEFHGCRAWENSDDAWDMYYTVFPVLIENCWALKSGKEKGNGNGFKVGGAKQGGESYGAHVLINDIAAFNESKGFDQNHHTEGSYMINVTAFENGVNYGFNMEAPEEGNWVLRNCLGFAPVERNHQFEVMPDAANCNWLDIDGLSPISDRDASDGVTDKKYNKYGSAGAWPDYTSEFEDLSYETAIGPRQADGSLPAKFGRLKAGSRFIDKGTPINSFKTVDSHKKEYEYSENAPYDYSMTIDLPFEGNAPDYGAFEYGGNDNAYDITQNMPENDGSVDEEEPEVDDGRYYADKTLVNNYLFQDAEIADEVRQYITGESQIENQGVDPLYNGKISGGGSYQWPEGPGEKYGSGTSYGAYRIPKTGWIEFTLPNLGAFKSNIYCTGNRTLAVEWHYADAPGTVTTKEKSMSTGTVNVDIAGMIGKVEMKPIVIRLVNKEDKGDMFLTDLTLGCKYEVDENGDPVETGITNTTSQETGFDIYQLDNALIVYGDMASIKVYTVGGTLVAESAMSQYVSTSGLARGVYVVVATAKDGSRMSKKFIRK